MSQTEILTSSNNNAINQIKKKRIGRESLSEVHFEITHQCNLRCFHCYLEPIINEPQQNLLSTSEIKGILTQLYEMGVFFVTFSGGEPLLRPDIFEILNFAKEQGLFFGLMTNGTLITESVADGLKEAGTVFVDISLHGAKETTHENITKVKGSFIKALNAIELLQERKIRVGIKTTLMKCNADELIEMKNIAEKIGARYTADPIVFANVKQTGTVADIRVDDEQLIAIARAQNWDKNDENPRRDNLKNHLICGAGRTRYCISSEGDVFPCATWRLPLGNLKQQSLKDIWNDESANTIRTFDVNDIKTCKDCELVNYCARCSGLIYMDKSDISGPSSENCRLARIIKGVRNGSE